MWNGVVPRLAHNCSSTCSRCRNCWSRFCFCVLSESTWLRKSFSICRMVRLSDSCTISNNICFNIHSFDVFSKNTVCIKCTWLLYTSIHSDNRPDIMGDIVLYTVEQLLSGISQHSASGVFSADPLLAPSRPANYPNALTPHDSWPTAVPPGCQYHPRWPPVLPFQHQYTGVVQPLHPSWTVNHICYCLHIFHWHHKQNTHSAINILNTQSTVPID